MVKHDTVIRNTYAATISNGRFTNIRVKTFDVTAPAKDIPQEFERILEIKQKDFEYERGEPIHILSVNLINSRKLTEKEVMDYWESVLETH